MFAVDHFKPKDPLNLQYNLQWYSTKSPIDLKTSVACCIAEQSVSGRWASISAISWVRWLSFKQHLQMVYQTKMSWRHEPHCYHFAVFQLHLSCKLRYQIVSDSVDYFKPKDPFWSFVQFRWQVNRYHYNLETTTGPSQHFVITESPIQSELQWASLFLDMTLADTNFFDCNLLERIKVEEIYPLVIIVCGVL